MANGNNESFTPISFGAAAANPGSASQGSAAPANVNGTSGNATRPPATQTPGTGSTTTGTETPTGQDQTAGAVPRAVTSGKPALGIEQKTVVAGRALAFTGQGFAPGEQVVGTLASGITAAGPITAGTFGEVAGAVQIPADMVPGTHKLKLTGAGSGTNVEAEFSVMANPATLASPAEGSSAGVRWALVAVIVAGSLLFLVILVSLVTALARRNKNPESHPKGKKRRRPSSRGRDASAPRGRATGSSGAVRPADSVPGGTTNNQSQVAAAPEPATNALELLPERFSKETV